MLTIAGAGMAGLAAAARARELGLRVRLLEKGTRPGGSMLLSSGVIWRYRSLEEFRCECPTGEPRLQALVVERLDEALDWLESLGAVVTERGTGNPQTVGRRLEPRALTEALVRAAGIEIELGATWPERGEALLLATGGFGGERRLVRDHITPEADSLLLRANPWSVGDGLLHARAHGARLSAGMDEFYGRAMPAAPARVAEQDFVPLAQLYGRFALAVDDRGDPFAPDEVSWSETELVQALARRPAARAWYLVDGRVLREEVRGTTVAEMIGRGERAGGTVYRAGGVGALADTLGFELPDSPRLREAPFTAVHVVAGITHTIGGIATDAAARVLGLDGAPIEGLYAAGADAGGVSTGGYASGLATALVFGRIAAETAARA